MLQSMGLQRFRHDLATKKQQRILTGVPCAIYSMSLMVTEADSWASSSTKRKDWPFFGFCFFLWSIQTWSSTWRWTSPTFPWGNLLERNHVSWLVCSGILPSERSWWIWSPLWALKEISLKFPGHSHPHPHGTPVSLVSLQTEEQARGLLCVCGYWRIVVSALRLFVFRFLGTPKKEVLSAHW